MENFKSYLNHSLVDARAMTRVEYNRFRGWDLPKDENPDDAGYLIVNKSVSDRNVDGYDGYVSWLPERAFEELYIEVEEPAASYDFGDAVRLLKTGHLVAREGWNGKGMYLLLVKGDAVKQAVHDCYSGQTGFPMLVLDAIYMKTAGDELVPWLASQTDMLANDWVIVAD